MIYGYLVAFLMVVAIAASTYWQGRKDGSASVQVKWDQSIIAQRDAAEADRKAQQQKAAALSRRYEAKVATQRQVSATLAEQLDAALKSKPLPVECRVDDGMRDNLNASLAGKGSAGTELPASGGTTTSAKDRPDGGNR